VGGELRQSSKSEERIPTKRKGSLERREAFPSTNLKKVSPYDVGSQRKGLGATKKFISKMKGGNLIKTSS